MRILSALVILAAAFPAVPAAAADMVAPAVVSAPDVSALDCGAGNALARIKDRFDWAERNSGIAVSPSTRSIIRARADIRSEPGIAS